MGEGKDGKDKVVRNRRGFLGALAAGIAGAASQKEPVTTAASVKDEIAALARERQDALREAKLAMKYRDVSEFDEYAQEQCR